MLTAAVWREELRARIKLASLIAHENEKSYGMTDRRTRSAYRQLDHLYLVAQDWNA